MAKKKLLSFTVQVDRSVKLSGRAKAGIAVAIGGAAAAELARTDLGSGVAFIPRIDWPGGRLVNLKQFLTKEQLSEVMGGA